MALNVKNGRRGLIALDKLVFAGDLRSRSGQSSTNSSSRSHKKRK